MRLHIDKESVRRFAHIGSSQLKDKRRYYITNKTDPINALIVCRNGLELTDLIGKIVDANIGNDIAWQGLAWEEEIGKPRTKITIYRIIKWTSNTKTLGKVIDNSTRRF